MNGTSSAIPEHLWMYYRHLGGPLANAQTQHSSLLEAVGAYRSRCSYGAALVQLLTEVATSATGYLTSADETDSWVRDVGNGFANTNSSQLGDAQIQASLYQQLVTITDTALTAQIDAVADTAGLALAQTANADPTGQTAWDQLMTFDGDPRVLAAFLNGLAPAQVALIAQFIDRLAVVGGKFQPSPLLVKAYATGLVMSDFTDRLFHEAQQSYDSHAGLDEATGLGQLWSYLDGMFSDDPQASHALIQQLVNCFGRDSGGVVGWFPSSILTDNLAVLAGAQGARGPWTRDELLGMIGQLNPDAASQWISAQVVNLEAQTNGTPPSTAQWLALRDEIHRLVVPYAQSQVDAKASDINARVEDWAAMKSTLALASTLATNIATTPLAVAGMVTGVGGSVASSVASAAIGNAAPIATGGLGGPVPPIDLSGLLNTEKAAYDGANTLAYTAIAVTMLREGVVRRFNTSKDTPVGPAIILSSVDPGQMITDMVTHPSAYCYQDANGEWYPLGEILQRSVGNPD